VRAPTRTAVRCAPNRTETIGALCAGAEKKKHQRTTHRPHSAPDIAPARTEQKK